jgi:hypothetical protein
MRVPRSRASAGSVSFAEANHKAPALPASVSVFPARDLLAFAILTSLAFILAKFTGAI